MEPLTVDEAKKNAKLRFFGHPSLSLSCGLSLDTLYVWEVKNGADHGATNSSQEVALSASLRNRIDLRRFSELSQQDTETEALIVSDNRVD